MANQTITTNTNFDSLTGLLAGETVTVNSGATLTIDSDPQLNRVLPGNITINDGVCFIDGTKVRELNFSGASALPAIGDTLTAGTVTGQVIGVLGTTTAGSIRLRSLNGAISNGTALSFTGGKTATASSSDRTGWLNILMSELRTITPSRLGSIVVQGGDWYYLGVSNGAAGQTFQFYSTALLPGLWVETGANTDQWVKYANLRDLFPAQAGVGERGNFFGQNVGNATITFGNGTNGNIPPNGARIRVCNVTIASALTSAPATPTLPTALANWPAINTTGGGELSIEKANISTFAALLTNATAASIKDAGCLTVRPTTMPTALEMENAVFGNASTGTVPIVPILINGSPCNIVDAVIVRRGFSGGTGALRCDDASNLSFSRCAIHLINRTSADEAPASMSRCIGVEMVDCDFIGGRTFFTSCSNITIENFAHSDRSGAGVASTSALQTNAFQFDSLTTDVLVDGVRSINSAQCAFALFRVAQSCDNIKIRNIGTPSSPYNLQNISTGLIIIASRATNITLSRCHLINVRSGAGLSLLPALSDFVAENISFGYTGTIDADIQNASFKAFSPEIPPFGQIASNGTHFGDFFTSETSGSLAIFCNEKTLVEPSASSYEATSGVRFNGSGSVLLRSVGDQIVYTWPWFILGHTGFANTAITFNGTNQANHSFEYRLDTGSGFIGSWKTLSGANLSAETISPSAGFRLQLRITCVTANTNNLITGILIPTTTTASDQLTLYPIDQVEATLSFTGLIAGSEIRIFRNSDSAELAGVESSGTTFAYTYTHTGTDTAVTVNIIRPGYVYQSIPLSLTASSNSLPIQQRVDYSYA